MKKLLDWLVFKQLTWASNIIRKHGYSVVRIEHVAGTDYILESNGTRHRIGGKK